MEILRITTAGSVDDGKSTLIGRLLYETDSLKTDQVETIEAKSKSLGYDYIDFSLATDGLLTEREQGITIDVSHLYFSTPNRRFIIADAPGHVEYTRNMVTGASNVNVAIILLDARKGVMEQTKRHLYITQLLGIKHLIFTINKMDLIDYDEQQFNSIVTEIKKLVDQYDWNPELDFIPVSALKGDNVIRKSNQMSWYNGTDLLNLIKSLTITEDVSGDGVLQVQYVIRPKTEKFHDYRGFAGKVKSGVFQKGDQIEVFPSGQKTTVKSIEKYGQNKDEVVEGENATLLLEDEIDASRGNAIVKTKHRLKTDKQLQAKVCWMQSSDLNPNSKYWLQQGVNKILVKVNDIASKIDWEAWKSVPTNRLTMNDIGAVNLQLAQPLIYAPYSSNKSLGAFILIDAQTNNTAGVGFIL
ncbi:MAG: GTP-binding protein [Flavobacteriaceae bacterium]|jgi:sulfate adenylyltransferase subunit 1|nr:GTP-binding protein [Flavobacteriaceae bacterium]MDG1965394.1 GTP-binding protein [Flavobacteriaceae bacterium]